MASKNRPPLLKLLILSTIWAPVAILASILFIASAGFVVFSPVIGLLDLWFGDYPAAVLYLSGGVVAFFMARILKRHFWEPPASLL